MQQQNVNVFATLLSGVLGAAFALLFHAIYTHFKERKERRLKIFRTLMTTRAGNAHPTQVEALNSIDIEFFDKNGKTKEVIDAWRLYSEHLNCYPDKGTDQDKTDWARRRYDLLVSLLKEMAKNLKYPFDEVMLRRNGYYPQGWDDEIQEGIMLRRAAISVFTGQSRLKVETKTDPEDLKAFTASAGRQ